MSASPVTTRHVVSRVAASLLGGYAFVWGFTSLGTAVGVAAGSGYHEAEKLMHLLAFLVFVVAFLGAFTAGSVRRVWAVLVGGGVVMTGAAWLLARAIA